MTKPLRAVAWMFALLLFIAQYADATQAQHPAPLWRVGVLTVNVSPDSKLAQECRLRMQRAGTIQGSNRALQEKQSWGSRAEA